jgi:hypothetical protein
MPKKDKRRRGNHDRTDPKGKHGQITHLGHRSPAPLTAYPHNCSVFSIGVLALIRKNMWIRRSNRTQYDEILNRFNALEIFYAQSPDRSFPTAKSSTGQKSGGRGRDTINHRYDRSAKFSLAARRDSPTLTLVMLDCPRAFPRFYLPEHGPPGSCVLAQRGIQRSRQLSLD